MDERLNRIFSYLNMDRQTGLATDDNINEMPVPQKLSYLQVKHKIGADAVFYT